MISSFIVHPIFDIVKMRPTQLLADVSDSTSRCTCCDLRLDELIA